MFTVSIGSKKITFNAPCALGDILREHCDKYCVAALVDGRICDLNKVVDYDCVIEPLDLTSEDGVRIYYRTLKFVFIMAVKKLFPDAEVLFMYGLSRGQYCEINGITFSIDVIRKIETEMQFIIKQNIPFIKETISKQSADEIYSRCGYNDKVELLRYRPENTAHIYRCGKECNYLYGYMMPSTGYLRGFKLHFHPPGLVVMYPRHELGGQIPDFEQSVKFDKALWRAEEWGKVCGVCNIAGLNRTIESGNFKNLVNMSEIRHEDEISGIARNIADDIKNIKLVLIAGPSSSGKTTFSRKLRTHLAIKGIQSIPVSCDDYFLDLESFNAAVGGNVDLEHIERIDLAKFNEDLVNIISGKKVTLPSYNFEKGKRETGKTVQLAKDGCVIVEGIHGLNENLTCLIPRYNKYKIYISALSHINIDDHTPISTTTCRLIRRAVRDNKFRGTSIEDTLAMWKSVRKGEFRWIYPYQEEADYIFNSELTYELAVLKKYIMPLIESIPRTSPYFITINKIQKIMKYVISVDDDVVPSTSLLREFIGGSNYV